MFGFHLNINFFPELLFQNTIVFDEVSCFLWVSILKTVSCFLWASILKTFCNHALSNILFGWKSCGFLYAHGFFFWFSNAISCFYQKVILWLRWITCKLISSKHLQPRFWFSQVSAMSGCVGCGLCKVIFAGPTYPWLKNSVSMITYYCKL